MDKRTGNSWLRPEIVLAGIVLVCVVLAFHLRFVQDDAFISFRYAENLAHGNGLSWNPGERVDGYTNFLWTVLMAVPFLLHLSPVSFSYLVGITCFAASLVLVFGIARRLLPPTGALLAVLLTGLNFSFLIYATGGLETPLVTVLLLAALFLTVPLLQGEATGTNRLMGISLVSVAALLTRLDSAVFIFVVGGALLLRMLRDRAPISSFAALLAPGLLIFAGWCTWQITYYGTLLPNTFYLKISAAAAGVRYLNGAHFVEQFFLKYLFVFLLLFLPFHLRKIFRDPALTTLCALTLAWCAYVVYAGGDFMEYRFLVVLIPVLCLLLTWLALQSMRWNLGPIAFGLALLAAIAPVSRVELFPSYVDVETRDQLVAHLQSPGPDWSGVGQRLAQFFGGQQVTIAVEPAGAIPFYSGLPAIDMLGLNDAWIARHGKAYLPVPGHYRIATLDYLLQRQVVLLIEQPILVPHDEPLRAKYAAEQVLHPVICDGRCSLPPTARLLRIPLENARDLQVVYVFPNPAVDHAIEQYHWPVRPIVN